MCVVYTKGSMHASVLSPSLGLLSLSAVAPSNMAINIFMLIPNMKDSSISLKGKYCVFPK